MILGHRVFYCFCIYGIVVAYLYAGGIHDFSRLSCAFTDLDGKRHVTGITCRHIRDGPFNSSVFFRSFIRRADKIHVCIQFVRDNDVGRLVLIILKLDLICNLITYVHNAKDAASFIRLGLCLLWIRNRIFHFVGIDRIIVSHLYRCGIDDLSCFFGAVLYFDFQGHRSFSPCLNSGNGPIDCSAAVGSAVAGRNELNVRIQFIFNGNIRCLIFIVFICDLIFHGLPGHDHTKSTCSLIRISLLFLRFCDRIGHRLRLLGIMVAYFYRRGILNLSDGLRAVFDFDFECNGTVGLCRNILKVPCYGPVRKCPAVAGRNEFNICVQLVGYLYCCCFVICI